MRCNNQSRHGQGCIAPQPAQQEPRSTRARSVMLAMYTCPQRLFSWIGRITGRSLATRSRSRYGADNQNRLFGHVTQIGSSEGNQMILLRCPLVRHRCAPCRRSDDQSRHEKDRLRITPAAKKVAEAAVKPARRKNQVTAPAGAGPDHSPTTRSCRRCCTALSAWTFLAEESPDHERQI